MALKKSINSDWLVSPRSEIALAFSAELYLIIKIRSITAKIDKKKKMIMDSRGNLQYSEKRHSVTLSDNNIITTTSCCTPYRIKITAAGESVVKTKDKKSNDEIFLRLRILFL